MWNNYKQEVLIFTCHSRFSLWMWLLWTGMWRSQVPLLHRWSWLWQLCAKEIFLFAEKWILFPTQKRSWLSLPSTTTNPYKWERIFRFYCVCLRWANIKIFLGKTYSRHETLGNTNSQTSNFLENLHITRNIGKMVYPKDGFKSPAFPRRSRKTWWLLLQGNN